MENNIKIPTLLKIYSFLLLVVWFTIFFITWLVAIAFLNDSLRDGISFTTPTANMIFLGAWIIFFLLSFQLLFFKKKLNILHYFVLLIWIIYTTVIIIGSIFYRSSEMNISTIVFFMIFIVIDIFCILCYKKIRSFNKLLVENKKNTLPNLYTTESQSKTVLIWFWIYVLISTIFYIFYFNRPLNIKNIPDSYFDTNYSYVDKTWKSNSINELTDFVNYNKDISSKNSILDDKAKCILSKNLCGAYIDEVTSKKINEPIPIKWIKNGNAVDWEYDISPIVKQDAKDRAFFGEISKLNDELYNKIVLNRYLKIENDSTYSIPLTGLISYCRLTLLSSLYDIQSWDQNAGIMKLLNNYAFWQYFMYWENQSLILLLVWDTIEKITLDEINFIVNNYELDSTTKKLLTDNLKNEINIDGPYINALKHEYGYMNKNASSIIGLKAPLLFDGAEMKLIRANLDYLSIEKKFDEIPQLRKEIEPNLLRKNYISSIFWIWAWMTYEKQYNNLKKLNETRVEILTKLNNNTTSFNRKDLQNSNN